MRKLPALVLALVALAACKPDEDYKNQPIPAEPTPTTTIPTKPMPVKKKVLAPEELGTCKLSATGAVTKEQTSQGGRAATNVSYWMKDEERRNMMGLDGFVVNCHGPDIRFSLLPSGKKDGMPFKPKKYEITKGGDANVTVTFGKPTLDGITGSVDVTAFDARHIAGTVNVRGKLVPGGGEVKVTGSFDLVCPGFSACE